MGYWQKLFNDLIYIRVCIALLGLLLSSLFALPLIFCHFNMTFWDLFGVAIVISMILLGIYLLFMSVFANDRGINKMGDYFDLTGADIVGVIFVSIVFIVVGIAAIPITMFIRCFKPRGYL